MPRPRSPKFVKVGRRHGGKIEASAMIKDAHGKIGVLDRKTDPNGVLRAYCGAVLNRVGDGFGQCKIEMESESFALILLNVQLFRELFGDRANKTQISRFIGNDDVQIDRRLAHFDHRPSFHSGAQRQLQAWINVENSMQPRQLEHRPDARLQTCQSEPARAQIRILVAGK